MPINDSVELLFSEWKSDKFLGIIAGKLLSIDSVESVHKKPGNMTLLCTLKEGRLKTNPSFTKLLASIKESSPCAMHEQ